MHSGHAHELRGAGLRVTDGRVALLAALTERPHSSADRLQEMLSDRAVKTSIQSVHNILADLTSAGLLRRIEPAGSPARYERRVGDNHHHVVCTSCGSVADVDCLTGDVPCLHPADAAGYALVEAEVIFWGLCPECQAAAPS